jgi:hypothetical protein
MQGGEPFNVLVPPPDLKKSAERMRRITGFVTALCPDSDRRPLAFARYFHVRRVAWTASLIERLRHADGIGISPEKVHWLAWAHDLNRWPFAHNAEKGLFDQSADVPRYFFESRIPISRRDVIELKGIISKDHETLSEEGRIVLLADIITGFIEDPLWATTALDLTPDVVPKEVAEYLCIPLDRPATRAGLLELNWLFAETYEIEPFETKFDTLFQQTMQTFIRARQIAERIPLGDPEFEDKRGFIKEDFMRKLLFKYNNEKISKGPMLRSELIDPLYRSLGTTANLVLTAIDEPEAIERCIAFNIIKRGDETRFLPDLDYVINHEPEKSFRKMTRAPLGLATNPDNGSDL